jgi:hypothetical protein
VKKEETKRNRPETIITLDEEGGEITDDYLQKLFGRPVTGEVRINANKGKARRVHLIETVETQN